MGVIVLCSAGLNSKLSEEINAYIFFMSISVHFIYLFVAFQPQCCHAPPLSFILFLIYLVRFLISFSPLATDPPPLLLCPAKVGRQEAGGFLWIQIEGQCPLLLG